MTDKKPLLSVRQLSHRFPDGTVAIDKISFDIEKGEFLIISGPNGSGKSVLMRHLNGLLAPTSGDVLLNGESIYKNIRKTRQQIGLVFQDADSQIIGQTVERDTAFGPENLRLERDEIDDRVLKALKNVDLLEKKDHRPHLLSGGEKRRLAIGGILAMDSDILIFDEPFSNLDFRGVKNVLRQITGLHEKGHTVILITHDLEKVLAHGNRLIIMNHGKIIHSGLPANLLDKLEPAGIRRPKVQKIEEMSWLK